MMKISIYSSAWSAKKMGFDLKGALDNWSKYADEIIIAVNKCNETFLEIAELENPKVSIVMTDIDFEKDPFAYGKVIDSALQFTSGDLLIQQDLDERFRVDPEMLPKIYKRLKDNFFGSCFVPTIDLYGDTESYVNIGKKWYIHLPGFHRGPVKFGIKSDNHPDYNKTSTDELIDKDGNLVPTLNLFDGNINDLQKYVERGMPIVYHLGYLNLIDRAERAKWWKDFWVRATNGDSNTHITDVKELLKRETKKHGLPLW